MRCTGKTGIFSAFYFDNKLKLKLIFLNTSIVYDVATTVDSPGSSSGVVVYAAWCAAGEGRWDRDTTGVMDLLLRGLVQGASCAVSWFKFVTHIAWCQHWQQRAGRTREVEVDFFLLERVTNVTVVCVGAATWCVYLLCTC